VSLAITPNGQTLYVTNRDSNTLSVFSVAADGTLTELTAPVPSEAIQPQGLAVTPDGRFLYVSHRGADAVDFDVVTRFAIGRDGTLTPLGKVQIGQTGNAMAVTPDGRFLFVPCSDSRDVYAFQIDAGGDLTQVPGSPFPFAAPDRPIAAAASPDGRHLYVPAGGLLNSGSRTVRGYEIGGNGTLTSIGDFMAGDSPDALTPAPSGRQLYVSNLDSDDVSAFGVDAAGALSELPGSPFPLDDGAQPALQSVAISPNQAPLASFTVDAAAAGQPTRFDASATTDPDGKPARFDWDFGDGSVLPDGGTTPTHVFRTPGTFTVTLTVTDDEGCSTSIIYTGTSTLCNGSRAATTSRTVTIS
jgi:6-phosphogluconolactonase (cycloisomerase 2 family)